MANGLWFHYTGIVNARAESCQTERDGIAPNAAGFVNPYIPPSNRPGWTDIHRRSKQIDGRGFLGRLRNASSEGTQSFACAARYSTSQLNWWAGLARPSEGKTAQLPAEE
jgi:hypothetical protein